MNWLRGLNKVCRIEVVILFFWLALFSIHAAGPISDPDTPWHLATGEYILLHHTIPTTDPFSWSMHGQPWITQEWLFEVIIAWLSNHVGFIGLWGLVVAIHTVTVLIVYRLCVHVSEGQRFFSSIAACLATAAGLDFWVMRPQLISYMMFATFLWLLGRVEAGNRKLLWLVPPLILFWANAHASVSIGILMIVFELLLSFVPSIGRLQRLTLSNRSRLYMLLTAVVSVAIGLMNPNTYHEFTYALLSNNSLMTNSINEWHSPNFHANTYKYGAIPLLAGVVVIAIARKKSIPFKYLLYFGATFALTLVYQRFMPYLAIASAPLIAWGTSDWLSFLKRNGRLWRCVSAVLLSCITAYWVVQIPNLRGTVDAHFSTNAYPIDSVNYIKQHAVPGPLFNAYDFGGYLIYRHVPTFVDGRTDIFLHDNVFANYMDLQNLAWNAPDLLKQYGFNSAILPSGYAISVYLTADSDWHIAYSGPNAEVFVRNKLIHKTS